MSSKYGNAFSATLNGIRDLFRKKEPVGILRDSDRIDGKTCLVTGANSGLGFAIARQLAERGGHVIMACRSGIPEAGEQVKTLSGSEQVEMLPVDLTDIPSIHQLVAALKNKGVTLDIAIFNAAMVPSGSRKTAAGFDEMFMVNYLSKFILVNALLKEGIIRTVGGASTPRIIFVSSESHRTSQPLEVDQLGVFQSYTMGKVVGLYGYYKLVMNTFAAELQRRINPNGEVRASVHALCPGPVNSNIAREAPSVFKPLLKVIFGLFFADPMKAAAPVLYLACSPAVEGKDHMYLHLMQEKSMDEKALDPQNGRNVWQRSEHLLTDYETQQHN